MDYQLCYLGDLPRNVASMHWTKRYQQRNLAMRYFGKLPPSHWKEAFAEVVIRRVMGPRQRRLDGDVFQMACRGLRDALTLCCYIVDDGPNFSNFEYVEDSTRRHLGPRVEVDVTYTDRPLPVRRKKYHQWR